MTIVAAAGGGNWSAGGSWVGGVAPTASDDAQLTATSGNITIDANVACRSLDCTLYTGTLTHTAAMTLSIGDATAGLSNIALKLVAGMTYTVGSATTSILSFVSTSATVQTITTGGKTLASYTLNGVGASYQLTDANTIAATSTMTLQNGTFNTNNQACSWGIFTTNFPNNTGRVLTLGSSAITITGTGTAWNVNNVDANITLNAGTSTITCNGSSANFSGGTLQTYNNIVLSGSFATITAVSCANLTRTGTATKAETFKLSGNLTVSGTLTINGNSITNRCLFQSTTVGTTRTVTVNTTVTTTNLDVMDITAAGSASWDLSAITGKSGDAGGNTGITFTPAATQTWSGTATGSWSTNAWTTRVPLPQDDVSLGKAFSASQTVTLDMPRVGKSIDLTGATGTPTISFGNQANTIFGSLTLIAGCTISGTQTTTFAGRGSFTITTAGKTLTQAVTVTAPSGTYQLQDNFLTNGALTLNNGTFDANNKTVSCLNFASSNSNVRALILGTGQWSLTATTAISIWNIGTATNMTLTSTGSTIAITVAGTNSRTFAGGGLTYATITYTVTASTGALVFTGANTIDVLNFSDSTNARTITFPASTTTTILTIFNVNGTSGKLVTINSSTSGTQATLFKTGSYVNDVSCDNLSIQDSNATGESWYAGAHSTNVSNNTGWIFTVAPTLIGASYDRNTAEKIALQGKLGSTNYSLADLRKLYYGGKVSQNDALRAFLQSQTGLTTVQSLGDLWRQFFIGQGITNQVSRTDMAKLFFANVSLP